MRARNIRKGLGRPRFLWLTACTGVALAALPMVLADNVPPRTEVRAADGCVPFTGRQPSGAAHRAARELPNIVASDEGERIRVDTDDGPVWIKLVNRDEGGYPACLNCHDAIENVTINMLGKYELDCTFCHGGDPYATTKEAAHIHPTGEVIYDQTVPPIDRDLEYQQFVNPSNLRSALATCGMCHPYISEEIVESMMATAAGHYAGGLYQNNVVDTKTPIYGTFEVADEDGYVPYEQGAVQSLEDLIIYDPNGDPNLVSTHFAAVPSQACARCHLWSRGKGYRGAQNADGVYRADGCAACHMLYDDDGLSQSADASINHAEPGHAMHHIVTREIPTEQCLHCHHRGARIGLNFTGRAQMPPRLPSGPGVPGTTDVKFNGNYHYAVPDTNPSDAHREAGLNCIDCHVGTEVMGDGNIYGHMDQATKIECRTCHGLPDEFPTLMDNDGMPLPNAAFVERPDAHSVRRLKGVEITSKVTGEQHTVPLAIDVVASNPNAACAMNGNHLKTDGGLECYSCHSSWVPNCFGCHFERDEREMGLNLMTREYEVGRARTNNKIFESLRHFTIGPNSEGRVAPYIVACQPIADVTAPDGTKILDFVMPVTTNGLSGLAHNPVNPHTVRGRGEVRTCAECHRSPPSLGFGSGNYTIARDTVYAAGDLGVQVYDRADPARPRLAERLPGVLAAQALASLPNTVEGTAEFLYVAEGANGVKIFDRRPGAPADPVATITGVDAIDVSRVARYLYVVDQGVGVRIYDNEEPDVATLVATLPVPTAIRAVPWGIHLFVAAGEQGLVIGNIADHLSPYIEGTVTGMDARDVRLYAHYQSGSLFDVRAYVADPEYGVRIVDLLPDYDAAHLVGGLPLPGAAGLDAYTRYVTATATEPSREHDYLYVAAGSAGLHIFDITDPDGIFEVGAVTDLGGVVTDVDVASQLAPPGVDDYAILANELLGLQIVDVNDPSSPIRIDQAPHLVGALRVLVETQQMDRFLDEQGNPLKENSHPFVEVFTRDDVVRILSAPIDCGDPGP